MNEVTVTMKWPPFVPSHSGWMLTVTGIPGSSVLHLEPAVFWCNAGYWAAMANRLANLEPLKLRMAEIERLVLSCR
jgi:hypothetical protein